tara:strand:+ start:565 stop:753 length:189 start_codon:yes stop_codon:yes gene_type:complete
VRYSEFEVRSLAHIYNLYDLGAKVKEIFVKSLSASDKSAFILGYRGDFDRLTDDHLAMNNIS